MTTPINDEMAAQGQTLFRFRSFIPLIFILPGYLALSQTMEMEGKISALMVNFIDLLCLLISLCGLLIRVLSVGFSHSATSGRNTKRQLANFLNTTGMYSIVRNPLYLGNYLMLIGVALSLKVWWFPVIVTLSYWLYMERIIATEERFLTGKFGEEYYKWAASTPAFIPKLSGWTPPALEFLPKKVLRREIYGFTALIVSFFLIKLAVSLFFRGETLAQFSDRNSTWLWGTALSAAFFCVIYALKKTTKILTR